MTDLSITVYGAVCCCCCVVLVADGGGDDSYYSAYIYFVAVIFIFICHFISFGCFRR